MLLLYFLVRLNNVYRRCIAFRIKEIRSTILVSVLSTQYEKSKDVGKTKKRLFANYLCAMRSSERIVALLP